MRRLCRDDRGNLNSSGASSGLTFGAEPPLTMDTQQPTTPAATRDDQQRLAPAGLLGDIVASKTKFVMQMLDTKGNGEWCDQNWHQTAEEAIRAKAREEKWDSEHEMTRWKYRAIIRIQSDHLLSPNDRS